MVDNIHYFNDFFNVLYLFTKNIVDVQRERYPLLNQISG